MKVKKITLLIAVGLLCSCDPGYEIKYSIVNKTSNDLKLIFTQSKQRPDELYLLDPNEKITISYGTSIGHPNEELNRELLDSAFFKTMVITKGRDSLKLDIQNSDMWAIEAFGDTVAEYKFIIKPDTK